MDDVTCRITKVLFALLEQRRIALEPLVDGLPAAAEILHGRRRDISWDVWAELSDRVERLGGPDLLEQLGVSASELPIPHEFKRVARLLSSTRQLYKVNSRWGASADVRCIRSTCIDLPDGRLRVEMSIPTYMRGSTAAFRFPVGVLRGLPRLLDEPLAIVDADVGPHRGIYTITLPPAATAWARIRRRVGSLMEVRTAFGQLEAQQQEIVDQNRVLAEQVRELRRVEQALRDSEARWRSLAENAPGLIAVVDTDGRIRSVNRAFFGVGPGEAVGQSLYDLLPPESHEPMQAAFAHVLSTGHATELEIRTRDAPATWHMSRVGPMQGDGEVRALIVMLTDVSDRKRGEELLRASEERLRQSQKMEALGRLAGGVAHDFNNLLAVILSYASLLLSRLPSESPARADLAEITHASQRAAMLTRQLLAFSRQAVIAPTIADLNAIVATQEKMLRRIIGEDIDLRTTLGSNIHMVKIDQSQMEQVLMNLVVNARDAMPDGGALTIETGNVELDALYASSHPDVDPGPHVMLAVSDTGTGIAPEHRALVFEPFFTTKDTGKGTGLGLSTVRGLVQQSGGSVVLYSELGLGTTIRIYLPATSEEPRVAASALAEPAPRSLLGIETILLVEDEPQVRAAAGAILAKYGYQVLSASGPADAISQSRAHDGPVHLLLTDVVMPQMSGKKLAEHLAASRPAMKVLFMSGYAEATIVHRGVAEPGIVLLQKPFTMESLSERVRDVLDTSE